MTNIITSPIGLVHTIFAFVALITGTIVLFNRKGTLFHKRTGYIYVFSMLMLNITAFGLYRLFGGFGVFHFLALVSLFAIFGGMYPVLNRNKVENWYVQHVEVMGWSIVGLYAALVAEVGVRFFEAKYFGIIVGLSAGLVCFIGAKLINKRKDLALEESSQFLNKN